ncbi:MAG: hypothetical protein JWP97_6106 [Labilithrix sp.]|nr:hypothetical protein [Labilithrix sp.]
MMRFRTFAAVAAVTSLAAFVACSSTDSGGGGVVVTPDAGDARDSSVADAGEDAAVADTGAGDAATGCTGACKTLSLVVSLNGQTRMLSRAQFGTELGDGGATFLHTEAHLGGDPKCPEESSPTPDYTMIVANVPRNAAGGKATKAADGVAATFLDFKGDLGFSSPASVSKATAVEITNLQVDPATPPAWAAYDFSATFAEGTVSGHVYDEHCASMDE